jgi:hypothetical protein
MIVHLTNLLAVADRVLMLEDGQVAGLRNIAPAASIQAPRIEVQA